MIHIQTKKTFSPIALAVALAFAAPAAAQQQAEQQLPEVTVKARPESATGPVDGYKATRSATGTKTDTPLIETPQAVTVVSRELIEDQRVETLPEALRYVAGVLPLSSRAEFEFFVLRGFTQSTFQVLDGMRLDPSNIVSSEPYGLERVEVLKGASSVLYGQMSPGGVINMVSKRPTPERLGEVHFGYGSFNSKRIGADLGGPFGGSGEWSYRLSALATDQDSQVDFVKSRRVYVAPALTWRPSPRTSFTLLTAHLDDHLVEPGFLPAVGTVQPNVNGDISFRRFTGEPSFDSARVQQTRLGYAFEHRFSDALAFRQNLRHTDYDLKRNLLFSNSLDPDQRTLNRGAFNGDFDGRVLTLDNQFESRFLAGGIRHTVLAGVDYLRNDFDQVQRFGTVAALDLFAPQYGAAVTLPANPDVLDKQVLKQTGFYLQDQMKFGERWVLVLGGRHDKADNETLDRLLGTRTGLDESANTGRAGVMYLAPNGFAPYASYSESFEAQAGLSAGGTPFKPTTGKQIELGLKYERPAGDFGATLALFDLKQQNVLTTDPGNPAFSVQTGEQTHRGLEIEATGRIARSLNLVGTYSYLDAKVTRSNDGAEGKRPTQVPRQMASLWATYDLPSHAYPGWRVGAGVRYVGDSAGDALNTINVPSYTLIDAALYYTTGPWRFALNAKNLTDKQHMVACFSALTCRRGDPLTVLVTAQYNWK